MSRPKNWWYGLVKRMISDIPRIREEDTLQARSFTEAYERAVQETLKLEDGDKRIQVIENVLIYKTARIADESKRLYYSKDTIARWISKFVNLCGEKAGY